VEYRFHRRASKHCDTASKNRFTAGAPNPGSPPNLNALVDQALRRARFSTFPDAVASSFAWSAVFICACVRRMAIQLGIEDEVSGNHVGRDELLLAADGHAAYVVEAYRRRFGPNQKDGTYTPSALTSANLKSATSSRRTARQGI
jgi:hypothetical protein